MRSLSTLTFALVLASPAAMAATPACKGGGPKDAVEVARNFSLCIKGGSCAGMNQTIFLNSERVLPPAKNGYEYREARVGADNAGGAGARRLVFLVGGQFGTPGAFPQAKYFTGDHYSSFCAL